MKEKLASPTAIVASRKARGTPLPVMPAASEPLRAMASKKESSRRSLPSCFSLGHFLLRIVQKERLLSYECLQSEMIALVSLRAMYILPRSSRSLSDSHHRRLLAPAALACFIMCCGTCAIRACSTTHNKSLRGFATRARLTPWRLGGPRSRLDGQNGLSDCLIHR